MNDYFPDPQSIIDPDGLVLIGDEVNTEILKESYSKGIFPWPHDELPVLWFCPQERGLLFFKDLHIGRSLIKFLKNQSWTFTMNQDFPAVIEACAQQKRPQQEGTWITQHLLTQYKKFHSDGYAHSVECWDRGDLIGGIYGVFIDGVFSGESMFHSKGNASKASLLALIYYLKQAGLQWLDIQMVTPLLESFGGVCLPRSDFLNLLKQSKSKEKKLQPMQLNCDHLIRLKSFS